MFLSTFFFNFKVLFLTNLFNINIAQLGSVSLELLSMVWVIFLILLQAFNKISSQKSITFSIYTYILGIFFTLLSISTPINSFFPDFYSIDFFTLSAKIILTLFGLVLFTNLVATGSENEKSIRVLLLNCLMLLLFLFVSSSHLFLTYSILEGINFLICGFIILGGLGQKKSEAVIKYFLISALTTGILLFGISELYRVTLTLNFSSLNLVLTQLTGEGYSYWLIFVLVTLTVGFLVKINVAPFYVWSIEVYGSLPYFTLVTIMIPIKTALFFVFTRIVGYAFYNSVNTWHSLTFVIAVMSILLGSVGALFQDEIKKFLIFASINQAGFILLAVSTGTVNGISSAFMHLVVYSFSSLAFFIFIVHYAKDKEGATVRYLAQLKYSTNIVAKLLTTCILLSLAGIPPFLGFFTKIFIIFDAVSVSGPYIALFILFLNIISGAYYVSIIRDLLFVETLQNYTYENTSSVLVLIAVMTWFLPQVSLGYFVEWSSYVTYTAIAPVFTYLYF